MGALFGGLLRGFAPIARMGFSAGKRLLQSDLAKNIGSTLAESGRKAVTNLAADLLEGKNVAQTAQEELSEARKKIASTLRGSGYRRKRKKTSCQTKICSRKRSKKSYNLLEDDD
ncbi:hypothetical protein [Aeromonas sobria]|uniref:hypothetical protein n=1 Tax=Aeromonas sobria TaxID=646 RepID=UPI003F3692FF